MFGTTIPSNWETLRAEDIRSPEPSSCVAGPFGSNISSKYFVDEGIPVIRGGNLTDDLRPFVPSGFVFVSEERAQSYKPQHVRAGDLVFTCWGTVGQVGRIPEDGPYLEYIISNKQLKLRPDPTRTDSHFLYYYFANPRMVEHIRGRAVGSAVPGINLGILKHLPVVLPPLATQRKIAAVLSTFDDVVDNNNRRVKLLEEVAERIYREWFVDFQYPGHEAVRLRDSELGPIPIDWQVRSLSSVVRHSTVTVSPGRFPDEAFEHFSIPAYDDECSALIERGRAILSNKFLIDDECVLYSKLNPRISRVWWANPGVNARALASTELLPLYPSGGWGRALLYATLRASTFADRVVGMAGGTSTSHQRVRPGDLLALPILDAPSSLRDEYDRYAEPMFRLSALLRVQSNLAKRARDLLLPRLLSGEIDVEDLDIAVSEMAA